MLYTILTLQLWNSVGKNLQPLIGYGVATVLDFGHPDFKVGDLVWGPNTRWEEYKVIMETESLKKIKHSNVSFSYYTGLLGKFFTHSISFE